MNPTTSLRLPPMDSSPRRQPQPNPLASDQPRKADDQMLDIGRAMQRRRRRALFLRSAGRIDEANALQPWPGRANPKDSSDGPARPWAEQAKTMQTIERRRRVMAAVEDPTDADIGRVAVNEAERREAIRLRQIMASRRQAGGRASA